MKTPRQRALIVEFSALAILLISVGWLAHFKDADEKPGSLFLIIPITASFFVLGGFISSLFFRWLESKAEHSPEAQKMQKAVFAFMAFSLTVIWVVSVLKIFKLF
jgi:hypothetical protein